MSYNAWAYVYANPTRLTDPNGHDPWWCENAADPASCIKSYLTSVGPAGCGEEASPCPFPCEEIPGKLFRVSAYYTPLETQWSPAFSTVTSTLDGKPFDATEEFLFSDAGVAMQGSGVTRSGDRIAIANPRTVRWQTTTVHRPDGGTEVLRMVSNQEAISFKKAGRPSIEPFRTVAAYTPFLGSDSVMPRYRSIFIPGIGAKIASSGGPSGHNGVLRVTDACDGCGYEVGANGEGTYGIDLYVGEGRPAFKFYLAWIGTTEGRVGVSAYLLAQ